MPGNSCCIPLWNVSNGTRIWDLFLFLCRLPKPLHDTRRWHRRHWSSFAFWWCIMLGVQSENSKTFFRDSLKVVINIYIYIYIYIIDDYNNKCFAPLTKSTGKWKRVLTFLHDTFWSKFIFRHNALCLDIKNLLFTNMNIILFSLQCICFFLLIRLYYSFKLLEQSHSHLHISKTFKI